MNAIYPGPVEKIRQRFLRPLALGRFFFFGKIWSRPNLDLKTCSLITVAALTALGRTNALRVNIEMALNNGAARGEIFETLLQMAAYASFPAC